MTAPLLTVVRAGPAAARRSFALPNGATILDVQEQLPPVALAERLRSTEGWFLMVDPAPDAGRIAAGLALARRFPEADIAIDDAPIARRDRRMIRTEGLRFLDPTGICPVILERDLALACLAAPSVVAAGRHWRWALAREAARQGALSVDRAGKPPIVGKRLPPVDPATLDAVAAAETGCPARRRILVIGRIEASVSLYFDGLPASVRACLRFYEAETLSRAPGALETADAAIVVRDLERCHDTGILKRLAALGIPSLYFADDNPIALAGEDRHWRFYTHERLRALLRPFHGVIASTPALVDIFRAYYADTQLFGPVLDDSAAATPNPGPALRVAIAGGAFRRSALERDIMPAILDIAATEPGVVVMAPLDFGHGAAGSFEARAMPRIASFPQFLKAWREGAPTALVHPRSATANDVFKTPNALLVALYVGAIPVVHRDEPAYAGLDKNDGVLKAADAREWAAALRKIGDPAARQHLWTALSRACARHFASARQAEILEGLADTNPPLTQDGLAARKRKLAYLTLLDPWPLRFARRTARRLAAGLRR